MRAEPFDAVAIDLARVVGRLEPSP